MIKRLALAVLACVTASAAHAQVAPRIWFDPGASSLPSYTTATVFQSFAASAAGTPYIGTTGQSTEVMGGGFWVDGAGAADVVAGRISTQDTDDNLLSLRSNFGNYGVGFGFLGQPQQYFSFELSGLAQNVFVRVSYGNTAQNRVEYNSAALGLGSGQIFGRLNFDTRGTGAIYDVQIFNVAPSGGSALLVDNFAAAAPEPATWALMILGFGAAGVAMRRSRKKVIVAYAAPLTQG